MEGAKAERIFPTVIHGGCDIIEAMTLATEAQVDVDHLVSDMLEKGPSGVTRPPKMPLVDFEELRSVLNTVIRMYHPHERHVPWQGAPPSSDGVPLIAHLKNRDYEAARSYLLLSGNPPLA